MAAGDLYLARIQYQFLGKQMENALHIQHVVGTGIASSLGLALSLVYLPPMKLVQSSSVTHTQIVVTNLDNSADFGTHDTSGSGTVAGDPCPPFVSWGFVKNTTDRSLKAGGLRLGVPAEASVTNGSADAAIVPDLDALAVVLGSSFQNVLETNTWLMVLHTEGLQFDPPVPNTVTIASVIYRRVTTQSSRKF